MLYIGLVQYPVFHSVQIDTMEKAQAGDKGIHLSHHGSLATGLLVWFRRRLPLNLEVLLAIIAMDRLVLHEFVLKPPNFQHCAAVNST